ncbi:thiY [Symbiodinium natans]|uniref:Thiamine pyrimidine synthase n=1 Tax=Symbiodinium natans TaxID=878477 RepID=A0A812TA85_9DINO|nr:thiY [Symbiodinium natans]
MSSPMEDEIVVALDWTPNTNHSGFYVAQVKLCSADAGDGTTPARQVAQRAAHFAVAPSESAVSFATTEPDKPRLVAVAALLQGSASAICTLKSSGIDRPAKLAGKRYASYNGRFEDPIVSRMVSNDGGDGQSVQFHGLDAHGYQDDDTMGAGSVVASYLEKGRSDSTWIFPAWEGVLAERAGQHLHCFGLEDYGIPYGYSPVLLAHPDDLVGPQAERVKAFLAATAEGYRRAAAGPEEAAKALASCGHPSLKDPEFLEASSSCIAKQFLTPDGKWGFMDSKRWDDFVNFLCLSGIVRDRAGGAIPREAIKVESLFTNHFLP